MKLARFHNFDWSWFIKFRSNKDQGSTQIYSVLRVECWIRKLVDDGWKISLVCLVSPCVQVFSSKHCLFAFGSSLTTTLVCHALHSTQLTTPNLTYVSDAEVEGWLAMFGGSGKGRFVWPNYVNNIDGGWHNWKWTIYPHYWNFRHAKWKSNVKPMRATERLGDPTIPMPSLEVPNDSQRFLEL